MIKTGLEFAQGTTDECKELVARLFQPGQILGAYRAARARLKTGDLVLSVSEQDPSGFLAEPRADYVRRARGASGSLPTLMRGLERTAHGVVSIPFQEDAMWLIVARGMHAVPVMVVLFASPYEEEAPDPGQATVLG